MKKQISIEADLGASGGKMARGYFDGDHVEIGDYFDFPNQMCIRDRINTEFAAVLDRHTVSMRVWERGSGETLACGTGACAVAVSSILNGLTEDEVTVRLLGGDLLIKWDREKDTVYMTGPAEVVFDGEWNQSSAKEN